MPHPEKKKATYEDLCALPENMVGEIIDGELHATPRPSFRHGIAASVLGGEIVGPFQIGRGGPGGWLIIDEPELHLGPHIIVPDMAGWRREKIPSIPVEELASVVPDWVCEILSPSTVRIDRLRKMPIFAEHGVGHLWLIDPDARTLEVFRLEGSGWFLASIHGEAEKVRAEPFEAVEIDLGLLFWPDTLGDDERQDDEGNR